MHPEAVVRLDHLQSERAWARVDIPFLLGMSFLAARMDTVLPAFGGPDEPASSAESFEGMWSFVVEQWSWSSTIALALDVLIAFVVASHVYRVVSTQARAGEGVWYRLSLLFPSTLAVCVGATLGELTSWGELARLASPSLPWTLSEALDKSVIGGTQLALMYLMLAAAICMVGPRSLRRAPKSVQSQVLRLIAKTLGMSFMLQVVANILGSIAALTFGGLRPWSIAWLPVSSMQPFPGAPSMLQSLVLAFVLTAVLALPRWIGILRKKETTTVHEGWIAANRGWPRQAA